MKTPTTNYRAYPQALKTAHLGALAANLRRFAGNRLIIAPVGPAGSGKTTLCQDLRAYIHSAHGEAPCGLTSIHSAADVAGTNLPVFPGEKDLAFRLLLAEIERFARRSTPTILADTAWLHPSDREAARSIAMNYGYAVAFVLIDTVSESVCRRKTRVPGSVFDEQIRWFQYAAIGPDSGSLFRLNALLMPSV